MFPRHGRGLACALPLALCMLLSGCARAVDLKEVLVVEELSGGYFDAGIVDGKNKLVPVVKFRIARKGDRPRGISLNAHFKKVQGNELEEWDETFLQNVEFAEGSRTALLNVRATAGYTGDPPQTRAEILKHSQFRDVRVIIFAKQSSSNWVELTQYDLPRQILTN